FKEKDAAGLYDYGARLYNPATGRWLSADASSKDGLNRYAYVRNNPLAYIDSTGHDAEIVQRGPVTITVDRDKHTIDIAATLAFAGPAADDTFMKHALTAINTAWSGQTTIRGVEYSVTTAVTGVLIVPAHQEDAEKISAANFTSVQQG